MESANQQQQENVKLIQKNVRGWLFRRQYTDIKCAVRVLQKCNLPFYTLDMRYKMSQRQDHEEIEDKIKDWLKQGPL